MHCVEGPCQHLDEGVEDEAKRKKGEGIRDEGR